MIFVQILTVFCSTALAIASVAFQRKLSTNIHPKITLVITLGFIATTAAVSATYARSPSVSLLVLLFCGPAIAVAANTLFLQSRLLIKGPQALLFCRICVLLITTSAFYGLGSVGYSLLLSKFVVFFIVSLLVGKWIHGKSISSIVSELAFPACVGLGLAVLLPNLIHFLNYRFP
jgi:hypothetical protein